MVGIKDNAVFYPDWELDNTWFESHVPKWGKKFERHTGIAKRRIHEGSEIELGQNALKILFSRHPELKPEDCAGGVCVIGSGIPMQVFEALPIAAQPFIPELMKKSIAPAKEAMLEPFRLKPERFEGINWGCSGFSRAMKLALEMPCNNSQYLLIVTATRSSRFIDYSDLATAGLFGDIGTATLLSFCGNEVLSADAEAVDVGQELFRFELRHDVLVPSKDGEARDSSRLVFCMDPNGVARCAPYTMRDWTLRGLDKAGVKKPDQVLPHQASKWIVDWTADKLKEAGIDCPVLNGLNCLTGNVSGSSIPSALDVCCRKKIPLKGITVCPTVGTGWPNTPTVSAGYIVFKS